MIYHSFPRVSQEDRFTRAEALDTVDLPDIRDILLRLPGKTPVSNITLDNPEGQPLFHLGSGRQSLQI